MMLRELTVKNFKLFDDAGVTINPGKVTVFVGANGTGKSSLLQVLLLLKQSDSHSQLMLTGPLINLGSFRDIVHLQDARRQLEIGVTASYENFSVPKGMHPPLPSEGNIYYHSVWDAHQGLVLQTGALGGENGVVLRSSWSPADGGSSYIDPKRLVIEGVMSINLGIGSTVGRPFNITAYSNEVAIPTITVRGAIESLFLTLSDLLSRFYFVPAIRGFDALTYDIWATSQPGDLTAAGGAERQASLVANVISSSPGLAEEVTERLNAILQGDARLRYRLEQGRLVSEMASGHTGVNLFNEAFGLNQLVAPLVWLSKAAEGSVVGIEEPEIHLHPRAQAALCDVLVEVATQERKQLILTTHSEHILMGLLTAVADGRLHPEDLAVYEFRRDGNAARAERLKVNEYGQIEGGLKGFLETDIDELGELIEARFQKQR